MVKASLDANIADAFFHKVDLFLCHKNGIANECFDNTLRGWAKKKKKVAVEDERLLPETTLTGEKPQEREKTTSNYFYKMASLPRHNR